MCVWGGEKDGEKRKKRERGELLIKLYLGKKNNLKTKNTNFVKNKLSTKVHCKTICSGSTRCILETNSCQYDTHVISTYYVKGTVLSSWRFYKKQNKTNHAPNSSREKRTSGDIQCHIKALNNIHEKKELKDAYSVVKNLEIQALLFGKQIFHGLNKDFL